METICVSCRKPRVDSSCGVCEGGICKKCRLFLAEDTFSFETSLPAELKHTYYCASCYDQHVEPYKNEYESSLQDAKQINVIYKGSKSSIRVLRKADKPVYIENSPDRDETILRLAFMRHEAAITPSSMSRSLLRKFETKAIKKWPGLATELRRRSKATRWNLTRFHG